MAPHSPVPGLPMFIESRAPPKPLLRSYHRLLSSDPMAGDSRPLTLNVDTNTSTHSPSQADRAAINEPSTGRAGKKTKIFTPHLPGRYLPTLTEDAPHPRLAMGIFTSLLLFFIATSGVMYRYDMGHVHPAGRSAGRSVGLGLGHVGHVGHGDMGLNKGLAQLGYFDKRDIEEFESEGDEERPDRFLNDYQDEGGFRQASTSDDDDYDQGEVAEAETETTTTTPTTMDSDADSASDEDSGLLISLGRGGRERGRDFKDQSFDNMSDGVAYPSEPADSYDTPMSMSMGEEGMSSIPTPEFAMPTINRRQTDPNPPAPAVPIASSSPSPSPSPTPTPTPNPSGSPTRSAPHYESTFRNADDVRDPSAVKPESEGMSMQSKDADGEEPSSTSAAQAQTPGAAVASNPAAQQPEARHWSSRKRGINAGTQINKGQ